MTDSPRESPPSREDDPINEACQSIDDKKSVDWILTDSKITDVHDQASARALRDLEKIAEVHRGFQQPLERGRTGTPHVAQPEPWGHLTVLELARAGTNGEVWRAWDAWLHREVALKFLIPVEKEGSDDSALVEEARALARIRHPGVVNVHGIGSHAGRVGMWMEFLEGATLEGEIDRRGPLPPDEVAKIGLDLCRALDAVVAAGLVHRDIKPANIVLEPGGRTVLTDFGLGKRAAIAGREAWRSSGTPLFMAPELLAGDAATPRSDLYAVGVTLRWALTGRAPFGARTLQELRVEAEAGPSTRLRDERPDAPPALTDTIERAMAPRTADRPATPAELAGALEAIVGAAGGARRSQRRRRGLVVGGSLIAVVALSLLARSVPDRPPAAPGRFTIEAPAHVELSPYASCQTISPDGRLVAFVGLEVTKPRGNEFEGISQRIWVRPIDSLKPRPLDGTDLAGFLFWSPDSKELGFFAEGKMKKIAISGGAPEILCDAPYSLGATWGKDGVIVFAPHPAGGLYRVSSEGGSVTEIQRPDSTAHETALRFPHFLPDGRRFFFVSLPPRDGKFDVFVADLRSDVRRHVMRAGCAPVVAGDLGIVVSDGGRLMLQGFDYDRLRLRGSPVALDRAPFTDRAVGQPLASASSNGVIVHLNEPLSHTEVVLLDRSGSRRSIVPLPPGRYEWGFLSPDGKRLIAGRRDEPTSVEVWLADLSRGQSRRFTMGPQSRIGGMPAWSPDGSRIAFSSNRTGRTNIYERSVEEAGEERLLYMSDEQFKEVTAWSPDGNYLVFEQASSKTGWDLWLLRPGSKGTASPYLASRFNEAAASISPDGRWLVYTSDASGKHEVYVRSFPTPGAEIRVWDRAGRAVWSSDGREILISHNDDGRIWSVPVSTNPTVQLGAPRLLFQGNPKSVWTHPAPTGDRFVEVTPSMPVEPASITVHMNVPRP